MRDASRVRASADQAEGIRRRLAAQPELELTHEELLALADHGIDPDEVRRIALEPRDRDEVSEHDLDTARDDLEALVAEQTEDPGA